MFQYVDKKHDIYQILSYCLRYLKLKIVCLLKLYLNEKNVSPITNSILQIALQQQNSQMYIKILKSDGGKMVERQEVILFQRFVYRIKEVVRNYLPYASVSHQLFLFLKKIETYSFKKNYKFEEYLIFILEENLQVLKISIQEQIQQLKKNNQKINQTKPQSQRQQNRYSSERKDINEKNIDWKSQYFKDDFMFKRVQQHQQSPSINTSIHLKQAPNRPLDIFNNNIKAISNCLDCDISGVRAIYFNLQKQRQTLSLTRNSEKGIQTSTTKMFDEIQKEMLNQNQLVRYSIKEYGRQYEKYQVRESRQRKRCQTAGYVRKQFRLNLIRQSPTASPKVKKSLQTRKKYQTIGSYLNQQQRLDLIKQIQAKKNNVLKMKSISISNDKGQFQLCSQGKDPNKLKIMSLSSMKNKATRNNSRNTAVNLKRRYQMYLNLNNTRFQQENQMINKQDTIVVGDNLMMDKKIDCIHSQKLRPQTSHMGRQTLTVHTGKQTIVIEKSVKRQIPSGRDNKEQVDNYKSLNVTQTTDRNFNTIQIQFQGRIKGFMKNQNLNHRNHTYIHSRQKKKFQFLNPELTVNNFRKS